MPNTIELAKKWVPLLDEVYKAESVTAQLSGAPELMREGVNANEISVPKITTSGLGDYSRADGYAKGDVNVVWETITFNYDRGRKFVVDVMDNQETFDIAFGAATGEFMRTRVAPEADAFTFATLASTPDIGTMSPVAFADGGEVVEALREATNALTSAEVPKTDRMLYIDPALLGLVADLDTTKSREVLTRFSSIIEVPPARFYTAIDLLSGAPGSEYDGGYEAATSANEINFFVIHKPALIKWDKHVVSNVIPAALNADSDGDIVKYRKYGIVDVYENKRKGLFLCPKAA
jgi:hypothetical protein